MVRRRKEVHFLVASRSRARQQDIQFTVDLIPLACATTVLHSGTSITID